jgi:UDP-N-acetylmuramate--alanine ligase
MKPDLNLPVPAAADLGRVHFIGVGGAGMSGIARILAARGVAVSGSDAKDSRALSALRALGVAVHVGHDAAHLGDAGTVVVSSAVRETNPELATARQRGLLVLHRAHALAAVMAGRRAVAVAGTHGKTTTTSMLTVALQHCGLDPSFAIGGELTEGGANAHDGAGDVFVAEADESDGSFLLYAPTVSVVTNVEADHLDHYGTEAAVEAAFDDFADRVVPGGTLVACADDPGAASLVQRVRRRRGEAVAVVTYGSAPDATVRVEGVDLADGLPTFTLRTPGVPAAVLRLRVPGRHNVLNAAAAWAAGLALGGDPVLLAEGLSGFGGTRRRFEAKGEAGGVRVFDDYAHHPSEVAAVLRAARQVAGAGRVVAVFQPHLFSRTRSFADAFAQALGLADEVVVMDVFAAREDPEPGVTGALIADAVPLPTGQVGYVASWLDVVDEVARRCRPGDLVLTIGAGDITQLGPQLIDRLQAGVSWSA